MDEFIKKYNENLPQYKFLTETLQRTIRRLLEREGIDFLDVQCRVKNLDSFLEKINRKGYKNPFKEIHDFCGLRVICYYPSDLDRIIKLIKNEFKVVEEIDKSEDLGEDKFGYRSYHYIIKVKDSWEIVPDFRGLEDFEVELQVRTILMHAWADISHKLNYKKEHDVPKGLRRRLNQLSALFEIADDGFDSIKSMKQAYIEEQVEHFKSVQINEENKVKDIGTMELNVDTLQALLDELFPDRVRKLNNMSDLVKELTQAGITYNEIIEAYNTTKAVLEEYEEEYLSETNSDIQCFTQTGMLRHMLQLANDKYYNVYIEMYGRDHIILDVQIERLKART
ncbi:MAG: hypothetical protein N3B21_18170 [Clostridia bacterium]|nr:hypothetical protein [Clostridia bacterium]